MRPWIALMTLTFFLSAGCVRRGIRPGDPLVRKGDEIVVAGQWFHTGTRVVTWMDPGGYDAYRVERRFAEYSKSDWASTEQADKAVETPNRYGLRKDGLDPAMLERVRGGGWSLPELQERIDQFVIHFDPSGTSRRCFEVLHDRRGLSVHFMLDLDGTIYQTLDLKERAWHATTANSRSVGIEIAQAGAFPVAQRRNLEPWYTNDGSGIRLTFPDWLKETGIATPGFVGRPARPEPIIGKVQDSELIQYDFTPQQYAALARLVATLNRALPKIRIDYPKDADGNLVPRVLSADQLREHTGLLGHYHVQRGKVDPGPAFNWDWVVREANRQKK